MDMVLPTIHILDPATTTGHPRVSRDMVDMVLMVMARERLRLNLDMETMVLPMSMSTRLTMGMATHRAITMATALEEDMVMARERLKLSQDILVMVEPPAMSTDLHKDSKDMVVMVYLMVHMAMARERLMLSQDILVMDMDTLLLLTILMVDLALSTEAPKV